MKKTRTKYIVTLLFLCTLTLCAWGQNVAESQYVTLNGLQQSLNKHEVRAVWLTTIKNLDWPKTFATSENGIAKQKKELCNILDELAAAGINTVMLQTRVRATTIYPSSYEPWSEVITGRPGMAPQNYDPLQFAIEECHKRKMELHAWVVTIPVGKWTSHGCRTLLKKHPKLVKRIKDEGYMDLENPQTGRYIATMCREITDKYDIDGIHLDYIRYPETWKIRIDKDDARDKVTSIVKEIHHAVKAVKPWVKVSCAPVGKYADLSRYRSYGWNAYNRVCQDAQLWMKEGYMDMLVPMMYFDGKHFYPFVMDWNENDHGRIVTVGLGTYLLHPEEKDWDIDVMERQIGVVRAAGLGHAHFRSKFFTDDTKGIHTLSCNRLNAHPALIPPMTWESSALPPTPHSIHVQRLMAGDEITWNAIPDLEYNVYASYCHPVDIDNPANLVAVRVKKPVITVPASVISRSNNLYYAVTAIDRYGNESLPQMTAPESKKTYWKTTLINDGNTLSIPIDNTMFDAEYVTIETLQGTIIDIKPYCGHSIDISSLPNGFYVVKSLGRKGVTHRLGFFTIKREA